LPVESFSSNGQQCLNCLSHLRGPPQTQAEVEVSILDHVFQTLPTPPFTSEEKQFAA
jgi:hypothetical protein